MRNRNYHTSLNLLMEPADYQRLKMTATLKKTTMSKLVREGIKMKLDKIDKENNAIIIEKVVNTTEQVKPIEEHRDAY